MSLKKKSKINAEFSMASMTDIIFLLLIFFIITSSVVKEPVMKILLPKGVSTDKIVNKVVHVFVTEDLRYAVEKNVVNFDDLSTIIASELAKTDKPTVSVGADKRVQYERVMELVKMCDQLGAKVVLALEKDGSVPSARKQ